MTPEAELKTDIIITEDVETSKTYRILPDKILGGIDKLEALQQAIYKMLNTEKYEYPIYGFSYGIELEDLIGKDPAYVKVELIRRIKECLLQDDRIAGVENFKITNYGDELLCTFDVVSIYGNISIEKEVNV